MLKNIANSVPALTPFTSVSLGVWSRLGMSEWRRALLAPDLPHTLAVRERVLYGQLTGLNPLNHRDEFSRPALRHGILNSPVQSERCVQGYLAHKKTPPPRTLP
jgi:hypothetical protein